MIELLNQHLISLSHSLTSLQMARNGLIASEGQVFEVVVGKDLQEKGYLTQTEMISLWLDSVPALESDKLAFVKGSFPFQEISYSLISKFVIGSISSSSSSGEVVEANKIEELVPQVIGLEFENFMVIAKINENLAKFVPTAYLRPTTKQFYDFVVCQQLGLDIEAVSKALYLPDLPPPIDKVKTSDSFPDTLGGPSVEKLSKTMARLKNRVRNLGGEWLS